MNKAWVKLLTSSNTRPFIPKTNKYKSDFFTFKFTASFMKLMELKGLKLKLDSHEDDTVHAAAITELDTRSLILPFQFEGKDLGFVHISENLSELCLTRMLGGTEVTQINRQTKPLSGIEKTTLKQLNSPLELSLREGLKGLLGIHDATLSSPWERLDLEKELSGGLSYFCETYHFLDESFPAPLQVYLRINSF